MRHLSFRTTVSALALVFAAGASRPATAQSSGNGYLFHAPEARITLRGGYAVATAQSDVFDFAIKNLTLNRRDFSGLTLGAEVGLAATERIDIFADAVYTRSSKLSHFRDFIDNNNAEIEQTTRFERVPLTLNARYYLTSPGRSVGKLAWIPAKVTPWVGAGAGFMYYRFTQKGDFVDYETLDVFPGTFETEDWTGMAQGLAGVDWTLSPTLAITTEARYMYGKGSVRGADFSGFRQIDLSGVSATVGLTIRM